MNNIGFTLHHLSAVLERQSDDLLMANLNLGYSQFKILLALADNRGIQQKEIAKRLGQTEASVSRQIWRMRSARLLCVAMNPDDRRERITTLSPSGSRKLAKATSLLNSYLSPVFDGISAADQDKLVRTLEQIYTRAINL